MTATCTTARTRPATSAHGVCRWVGGNSAARRAIDQGFAALLSIQVEGKEAAVYYVCRHGDRCWRLQRLAETNEVLAAYLVTNEACTCPDSVYRPARQGRCKHSRALRVALRTIGMEL